MHTALRTGSALQRDAAGQVLASPGTLFLMLIVDLISTFPAGKADLTIGLAKSLFVVQDCVEGFDCRLNLFSAE